MESIAADGGLAPVDMLQAQPGWHTRLAYTYLSSPQVTWHASDFTAVRIASSLLEADTRPCLLSTMPGQLEQHHVTRSGVPRTVDFAPRSFL